jgi:hypothetical protein
MLKQLKTFSVSLMLVPLRFAFHNIKKVPEFENILHFAAEVPRPKRHEPPLIKTGELNIFSNITF